MYPPDYLNNLSPESKEYEDTQGKSLALSFYSLTQLQLLDMHQGLVVESQPLSVFTELAVHKSLSFLLCLCCSCLGDRLWGGGPGQWQSEAGGEFSLDTPYEFTFRLLSSCHVWHIHNSVPQLQHVIYILLSNERAIFKWSSNVKKLADVSLVQIPLLDYMLEWRRGLSLFGACWLMQEAMRGDVIRKSQVYHYKESNAKALPLKHDNSQTVPLL